MFLQFDVHHQHTLNQVKLDEINLKNEIIVNKEVIIKQSKKINKIKFDKINYQQN